MGDSDVSILLKNVDNCMQNANKRKHVFKFLGLYCITLFFLLLLFYFCSVLYLSFNFYLIKKKIMLHSFRVRLFETGKDSSVEDRENERHSIYKQQNY